MALSLTAEEQALITAVDAPMEEAFANGVTAPAIPPVEGYRNLSTNDPRFGSQKDLVKNAFKNPFAAFISALKGYLTWQAVTYENDWRTASGAGLRYYRNLFGEVRIQGNIVPDGTLDPDVTIATLPEGFRPEEPLDFLAVDYDTGTMVFRIQEDGQIVVRSPASGAGMTINITFKAA